MNDSTRGIVLGKSGKIAIVDEVDYEFLSRWKWQYGNRGYALRVTNIGGKVKNGGRQVCVLMHRVIMQPPEGMVTDHINGDRLDNRRCNLRIVTPSQNCRSQRIGKHNKSGFKGVSWNKRDCKWQVKITINNKVKHVGDFDDIVTAAIAYNNAAEFYFKEYAILNDIPEGYI
jgi:hypothetical protein